MLDLTTTTVGAFVRRRTDHELGRIVAIDVERDRVTVDYGRHLEDEDRSSEVGIGAAEVWTVANLNMATREELARMSALMAWQSSGGRIEALTAEIALVRQRWAEDIATIGEALLDEAESRGWCSEFDDFIESTNPKLFAEGLPRRARDWEVTVMVEVAVPVAVSAVSEEEAIEIASQEWRDRWSEHDWNARDAIIGGTTCDSDMFTANEI